MSSEYLRQLNERPVAYYPVYRRVTGSTTAGMLLSQLMYWFSKQNTYYKTDSEIMVETGLTADELRAAKKKIKGLSFMTIEVKGVPAKTYYTIDWNGYEDALKSHCEIPQTSLGKSHKPVSGNSPNCDREIPETINDKSFDRDYTETTTDIIPRKAKTKNKTSFPTDDKELHAYAIFKAVEKGINCPVSTYQEFKDHHRANGSKFVEWTSAFNTWTTNFFKFESDNRSEMLRVQGNATMTGTYSYEEQIFNVSNSNRAIELKRERFMELLLNDRISVLGRV